MVPRGSAHGMPKRVYFFCSVIEIGLSTTPNSPATFFRLLSGHVGMRATHGIRVRYKRVKDFLQQLSEQTFARFSKTFFRRAAADAAWCHVTAV